MDRRMFLASATAAVLAAACGTNNDAASSQTRPTASAPAAPRPAEFVVRGPNDANRVALTFHTDGDLGLAQHLLATLKARDAVMTSFIVGEWLDANPAWAEKLAAAGHELANHTYTHPRFDALDTAAMTDEIARCRDLLIRLTGHGGKFFRPSGTADGAQRPSDAVLQIAGEGGYRVVLGFDDDPLDYNEPGADVVAQRTLGQVKAGSIISLHFNYPGTVDALPKILDGLAQRELTPVTVSQLLSR